MAKVTGEGKFPKRIGDFVLYPLYGELIIRAKSGFTTEALKTSSKYDLSRKNASEFGKVSSMCKQLRVALKDVLPKKNNLLVVNSLTKKMRQVLVSDAISSRGERTLATALASLKGRQQLVGYHFNPVGMQQLDYKLEKKQVALSLTGLNFPDGANCVGFRISALEFDFNTAANQLACGSWLFYRSTGLPKTLVATEPELTFKSGVLFSLLEIQFYDAIEGSYIPLVDDSSKMIVLL